MDEIKGTRVNGDDVENRVGGSRNVGNKKTTISVEQDRLSSLPEDVIHYILSFNDTKYAVQASVLSSRWKFIWKTLPYLSFSMGEFRILPKFSKFVNRVLSLRNNRIQVSSVNLSFTGRVSQKFVEKIASYAMSHNVQKFNIYAQSPNPKGDPQFPLCLFSSQHLKHFSVISEMCGYYNSFPLPLFPWNFSALTTLFLKDIMLCNDDTESLDLFSKCVNLKNLTLKDCRAGGLEVMKIISPRLENLVITSWWITNFFISAPNLSSLYYESDYTPSLSGGDLQSLDKVNLQLTLSFPNSQKSLPKPKEDLHRDAQKLFNMFEKIRNAKHLTVHSCVVEFLSTIPDLLETQSSPFRNLKCLEIKEFEKQNTTSANSAHHVLNYFLSSSATAIVIMELPKEQPKKPRKKVKVGARESFMKQVDALTERQKAETKALVEGHLAEREAQWDGYKAELDAFAEHSKAKMHEYDKRKERSHTTSVAKAFQEQPMLDSNFTSVGQVSTTNNEELMKEGVAIYMRMKEMFEGINERRLAERETLTERHKAEEVALIENHKGELMAMFAEFKTQG